MGVQLWGRAERVGHLAPGYAVLPNLRLQPSNVKLDYDPVCNRPLMSTNRSSINYFRITRTFHTIAPKDIPNV